MQRVSPNIKLHHEIWDNTTEENAGKIPKIIKNTSFPTTKFWRREDILVPNTYTNVKKEIQTIHLLEEDDFEEKLSLRRDEEDFEIESVMNHDRCILLKNVLTEEECENLVNVTEGLGYNSIEQEYMKEYRNSERVVVTSKKLSEILWDRMAPYLKKSDFNGVKPYGFDNKGKWVPIGLNNCMRFNKYSENTFFKPHMDAQHCNNDSERSIFTVLIYLNYSRYGTRLLKKVPNPNSNNEDDSVMSFQELQYVQPRIGNILIFNHDLYHSGDSVQYGSKYIIRTEMIFKRIDSESIHRIDYRNSEEYLKVKQLVDESTILEKQGNVRESTLKYLKAHQLQAELSHSLISDNPEKHHSFIEQILPEEIFAHIFKYLPVLDVVKSILYLNKDINEYARNGALWKELYQQRWPSKMTVNNVVGYHYSYYGGKSTTPPPNYIEIESAENRAIVNIESERTSIFGETLKDWYQTFICRANMELSFCPVLLDLGAKNYRFGLAKDNAFFTSCALAGQPDHPHFYLPNYGMDDIVVGDRFIITLHHCSTLPLMSNSGEIVDFNNFKILLCQVYGDDLKVKLKEHPLLLAVSPMWSEKDLENIRQQVFELEIPALCMVDSRELVSNYYQKPNCLLVHIGASGNMCTGMLNHKPLSNTFSHESLLLKQNLADITNRSGTYSYDFYTTWDDELLQGAVVSPILEDEDSSAYKKFVSELGECKLGAESSYNRKIMSAIQRVSVGKKILISTLSQVSQSIQSIVHSEEITESEKKQILQDVVIVGGFSHLKNLTSKLTELILKLYSTIPFKIIPTFTYQSYQQVPHVGRNGFKYSHNGACYDVMGGAKIFASLNNFVDLCTFIDE